MKGRRYSIVCDLPDCTNVREQPFSFRTAAWTPDGRGFAYRNPNSRPTSGCNRSTADRRGPSHTSPTIKLTSFAWSPDGKRLVVSRATILSDLVLIKGFK